MTAPAPRRIRTTPPAPIGPQKRRSPRLLRATALHTDETDATTTELEAMCFDVVDDMAALVPMPSTIPLRVRRALTVRFAAGFAFYEDLHEWLHIPHLKLHDRTPFERLVAGDGDAVLALLGGNVEADAVRDTFLPRLER